MAYNGYNSFPTIDIIASESLAHLEDALIIKNLCATDVTSEFNQKPMGYAVGSSVQFRTDPVYEVKTFDERASDNTWVRNDSKEVVYQDIRSTTRTMYIEKHFDTSVTLTSRELAMDFDNISKSVIRPAMKAFAAKIDTYIATKVAQAQGLYASAAVLGTQADLALARKAALYQQLAEDKFILVGDTLEATLLGKDWFTSTAHRLTDDALTRGALNRTMGFDFYSSMNFYEGTHTNASGTAVTVTSPTTTQNKVGTSTLYVTAATTAMNAGDRIIVAGCKRPMIVKTAVDATDTTIDLVDPITEIIPVTAAVTTVGGNAKALTYRGAIFDSKSLGVAMPMLDKAYGVLSETASANGVSIRVIQDFDTDKKINKLSMDCLIGAAAIDPRRITLLADAA
jgi:hypothetical protein